VVKAGNEISIDGPVNMSAADIVIPGDVSSAAFIIAAASCLPGSKVAIADVGLNPTRTRFIEMMRSFGAEVSAANVRETSGEPVGDLTVRGRSVPWVKKNNVISGDSVAALIDELPVLAVVGTQIDGGLVIRDAAELRVKETDRIAAVVENLRRMNADIEEYDDGFRVGRSKLKGAAVDSFSDHRIAMAFAVAGILADGETTIAGAECVDISFPGFFETLRALSERPSTIPA
jgi:3-phosphoshikimate 1-carboxyvinyltransferase